MKLKLQTNVQIQSTEQLWEAFGREWYGISPDICKELIDSDSMPKRIKAVISAKGGPTKY